MRCASACLCLFLLTTSTFGQELPEVSPESVGLSSAALDQVSKALQVHIDNQNIAGVVATVIRDGQIAYTKALGYRDLNRREPMPIDALFRLYSMTRPITSLAVMMLWEEGKLRLDDALSDFIPAFSTQQVFLDADNPVMEDKRPRTNEITIEHLLTHTSGLGNRNSAVYRSEGVRSRSISLEQMVDNSARVPLFEDPGTRFRYGISTTVLGRVIEIVSGQSLDQFFTERVFGPLDMKDTVFWASGERANRLASLYRPAANGTLQPHAIERLPFTQPPTLLEGGVGLLSTVRDYSRFAQMVLNQGTLGGYQLLKPETIAMMTSNRIPDALFPLFGRENGYGWGLGFCIAMDPTLFRYPIGEGVFWWDGSAGTRFFIDPRQKLITVIMAQVSPANGESFREQFATLIDAAVLDRR
jgi:CubicO group peptidase (beta-lactamase class C family)